MLQEAQGVVIGSSPAIVSRTPSSGKSDSSSSSPDSVMLLSGKDGISGNTSISSSETVNGVIPSVLSKSPGIMVGLFYPLIG